MNEIKLPEQVLEFCVSHHGVPETLVPLSDRSPDEMIKVVFEDISLVAKKTDKQREISFYKYLAKDLDEGGASCASLEWYERDVEDPWILLEYIPHKLPENRWEADYGVMKYLAILHSMELDSQIDNPYRPRWDREFNDRALSFFDTIQKNGLGSKLDEIMESCQDLFNADCYIAGDPSPQNWGLRNDHTLLLRDWYMIGMGSPALDLAKTICSSEDIITSKLAAERYVEALHSIESEKLIDKEQLANDILKGCVWNYMQFLNRYLEGNISVPDVLIDHIKEHFPQWIKNTPIKI